jgi:hypothetical protein
MSLVAPTKFLMDRSGKKVVAYRVIALLEFDSRIMRLSKQFCIGEDGRR